MAVHFNQIKSKSELRQIFEGKQNFIRRIRTLESENCLAIVASINGQPIGLAAATADKNKPTELYLEYVGVDIAHQNKKIATQLMNQLEEAAKVQGFTEISLAVAEDPAFIKQWYIRLGFDTRPDRLLLVKDL